MIHWVSSCLGRLTLNDLLLIVSRLVNCTGGDFKMAAPTGVTSATWAGVTGWVRGRSLGKVVLAESSDQ